MLFEDDSKLEAPPLYQTRIPDKPEPLFESRLLKDEVPTVAAIPREPAVQVETGKTTPAPAPKTTPAPTAKVAAEPAPVARVGLQAWAVQVGSFSSRQNADHLSGKLKKAGFEAFVEEAEVEATAVFRGLVGPEADRVRADALLPQIKAAVGLKGAVKRYP